MSKSGIILIIVGCVALAHNFDLLQWGWLRQWWPAALIAMAERLWGTGFLAPGGAEAVARLAGPLRPSGRWFRPAV